MAEGLLGGVLGSDDARPEGDAPEARAGVEATAGAEAFAAAVAAIASRQDPGVARKTEAFLDEQTRLLATQRQHLEDEHALRLAQLAHQRSLLHGQRIGQVIRIAFQVVIALVVIVIGAGIAVMLHDAFSSHNVVIDAFDAPAALAARGVTGKVVAADVLDELTRLQNATPAGPAEGFKRNLSNAWSNQVTVEVPETGISLEELSQVLRARFGHDVHIGGALVQTDSGGLALTVRGDDLAAKTFTGASDALQQLTAQAAQYLYAQSEPSLWGAYLRQMGRCPEALAFIRSIYGRADPQYRPTLLFEEANCVADTGGSLSEFTALLDRARAIDPTFATSAYLTEAGRLLEVGDEEQVWRIGQKLDRLTSRAPAADRSLFEAPSHFLARDYSSLLPLSFGSPLEAVERVALHDPEAAEVELQNAPQISPLGSREVTYVRALIAEERGDPVSAAQQVETALAGSANPFDSGMFRTVLSGGACAIAPIEEAADHPEKADAILVLPDAAHFTDCQRFRGDILDHRGDWPGAQRAYAQAVALAPDLPDGYYSWGVALARHGDLAGAIAKLQAANQRGPHWADPLKAWGDVLVRQRHPEQAVEKYDEALKYAPNWAALKQARDAASKRG